MKKIEYDVQKYICINDELGSGKRVRITGKKNSKIFWAAVITNYINGNDYHRNYFRSDIKGDFYSINTEILNVGDVVYVRNLEGDTGTYCREWEVFFVVRKVEQDGLVIEKFPTLYQAIKGQSKYLC